MAIYHYDARTLTKSHNDSALGHFDYMTARGRSQESAARVIFSDYGNMPDWAKDSDRLYWEATDLFERQNGRLCKSLTIALPHELNHMDTINLVKDYIRQVTTLKNGDRIPFSFSIHIDVKTGHNPHMHLIISERITDNISRQPSDHFRRYNAKFPEKGGSKKTDELKPREWLLHQREAWALICNKYLEKHQLKPIDHRSLRERGINRQPEQHLGPRRFKEAKKLNEQINDIDNEIMIVKQSMLSFENQAKEALSTINEIGIEVERLSRKTASAPQPMIGSPFGGVKTTNDSARPAPAERAAEDGAVLSKEKRDTPAPSLPAWLQAMKAFEVAGNREQAEDALAACVLEINKLQKEKQKIDRELKDIIEGIPKAKEEMETAKILISASGDQRRHEAEAERAEQKAEAAKGAEAEAWKKLPLKYRDKFESGELDRNRPPQKWGIFIKSETKKLILDYINAHNDTGEAARAAAISRSVAKSMEEDRETNKVKLRHWENKLTELQPALPPAQKAAHRLDRELTQAEKGLEMAKARADQLWPERITEREKKARDRQRARGHGGGMSM